MIQDPLTLYKLIILYMLDRVSFPLTKSQIGDFILEKEYTDYLTLQQAFYELAQAGLVDASTVRNRTFLEITEAGLETLRFFGSRINHGIKKDVNTYLAEHELALRNEISVAGDYRRTPNGEYEAHLSARDRGVKLVDITLSVPAEEIASSICDNWQKKNQEIYDYLVGQLF